MSNAYSSLGPPKGCANSFPRPNSGTQRGGYGLRTSIYIYCGKIGDGWKYVPERLKPYLFSIVYVRAQARTLQSQSELEIDEVPVTEKAIENRGIDTSVISERAKRGRAPDFRGLQGMSNPPLHHKHAKDKQD